MPRRSEASFLDHHRRCLYFGRGIGFGGCAEFAPLGRQLSTGGIVFGIQISLYRNAAMPGPPSIKAKLVTSRLLESYLACPTKCYLQSIGEVSSENDFATWSETRRESYRLDGLQRLKVAHSQTIDGGEPDPRHWKHSLWDFAFNQIVRAQYYEAHLQAVQRVQLTRASQSTQFIPIRFVPATVTLRQTNGCI
jgi:hypothetical protein